MDLSTILPANFTSWVLGKRIHHIYLFPSHDWILIINGKPDLGLVIRLDNTNPRVNIHPFLEKNSQLKDLVPHALDQYLHHLIINNISLDSLFRLNMRLTSSPEASTTEFFDLRIQLAPYSPRLTFIKNDVPIFDSILGWNPKDTIKPRLSRFVVDDSLDIDTLHLNFISKEFQSLIKHHYQKKVKRQAALEMDLKVHEDNLGYQVIAEAIQIEPNLLWTEYPNPLNLPKPTLSFKCNFEGINHLFRLYKKAKQGIEEVKRQLTKNKIDIDSYLFHLNLLTEPNEKNMKIIQSFLIEEHLISGIKPKPVQVSHQSPYFVIDRHTKFSFGKNAKQNDYLTFSIAKKSDIFMHIHGEPGSHLILHYANFDHDTLIQGAQLVLALAKKMSGEVTYAKVGSLKRTTQLGQVIVKDAKKIKVHANPDWANPLLTNVKRY